MDKRLFMCLHERPQAVLRLICFPWAGGGALHYAQRWGKKFSPSIEVVGAVIPGRESRESEPLVHDFSEGIDKVLTAQFRMLLRQKPFAFFGHSMGAMYAFHAALYCKQFGLQPEFLFISGCMPPKYQVKLPKMSIGEWPREQVISYLRSLGGTPESVLKDKKMLDAILPIMAADFNLCDSYRSPATRLPPPNSLSCPLTTLSACDDPNSYRREEWQVLTSGPFRNVLFDGSHHLYLVMEENEDRLIAEMTSQLQNTRSQL